MTPHNTATEEQSDIQKQDQANQGGQRQRPLIPCEVFVLYIDKVNELVVCEDIPQNLPNGLIQLPAGDKLIVLNPQQVRRFEVRPIKQDEKRIIT